MDNIKDKSKDKLKAFFAAQITSLFGDILDLTEVALGDPGRQKALRSKVLKLSNDAIRTVQREVEERYTVSYVPPATDVIFVRGK
jgi:hypothetical protein